MKSKSMMPQACLMLLLQAGLNLLSIQQEGNASKKISAVRPYPTGLQSLQHHLPWMPK